MASKNLKKLWNQRITIYTAQDAASKAMKEGKSSSASSNEELPLTHTILMMTKITFGHSKHKPSHAFEWTHQPKWSHTLSLYGGVTSCTWLAKRMYTSA